MSELDLTERNIEDFKQNPVWIEMLETWAIRRTKYLEELSVAASVEDIRRIQGCITEIDYCMNQPDFILLEMEMQDKEEETEPESESGVTE